MRFNTITQDVIAEAERSIAKHGEQRDLPLGTGPDSYPLSTDGPAMFDTLPAEDLAEIATADTKCHSRNEGGNDTTPDVQLHLGDALTVAQKLPDGMVRTIVTSPPYFGLRDYGEDEQMGAEGSVDEYVDRMVILFRELRRVLADDGTLWLNLGDSYSGRADAGASATYRRDRAPAMTGRKNTAAALGTKQLLGVPWRVALAMQADGWILRSEIIWAKKNVMPESVTDRPTKSHEHIFLFAKSPKYFYDAAAIREEAAPETAKRYSAGYATYGKNQRVGSFEDTREAREYTPDALDGRNKRDVWHVATVPFPGAHFAVYPPELIRPCIRAGSEPGDTVLDPFSGSGTTGAVANFEGRRYVGIDLNREYLDLSLSTRFQQPTLPWAIDEGRPDALVQDR